MVIYDQRCDADNQLKCSDEPKFEINIVLKLFLISFVCVSNGDIKVNVKIALSRY